MNRCGLNSSLINARQKRSVSRIVIDEVLQLIGSLRATAHRCAKSDTSMNFDSSCKFVRIVRLSFIGALENVGVMRVRTMAKLSGTTTAIATTSLFFLAPFRRASSTEYKSRISIVDVVSRRSALPKNIRSISAPVESRSFAVPRDQDNQGGLLMAIIKRYEQQPAEKLDYDVYFRGDPNGSPDFLDDSDTIDFVAIDVSPSGLDVAKEHSNSIVKLWVWSGTHGITYTISVTVTINAGTSKERIKQFEIKMKIKETA